MRCIAPSTSAVGAGSCLPESSPFARSSLLAMEPSYVFLGRALPAGYASEFLVCRHRTIAVLCLLLVICYCSYEVLILLSLPSLLLPQARLYNWQTLALRISTALCQSSRGPA